MSARTVSLSVLAALAVASCGAFDAEGSDCPGGPQVGCEPVDTDETLPLVEPLEPSSDELYPPVEFDPNVIPPDNP